MEEISVNSASELYRVLSFLTDEQKKKIDSKIWEIFENREINSITNIKNIDDIDEKNLLPETKKYLAYIFLNYLANEEEKNEYKKILKNNEKNYQKFISDKYSISKVFETRKNEAQPIEECTDLIVKDEKYLEKYF